MSCTARAKQGPTRVLLESDAARHKFITPNCSQLEVANFALKMVNNQYVMVVRTISLTALAPMQLLGSFQPAGLFRCRQEPCRIMFGRQSQDNVPK